MKLVTVLLFTFAVAVFAKTHTFNGINGLYGTGVNSDGTRVAFNTPDPHWTLTGLVYTGQTPQDTTVWPGGVPNLPAPLYVVDAQTYQGRSGPCNSTDYNCYWISPASYAHVQLPGSFFYYLQTTFSIDNSAKINSASFILSISAADSVRAILINGVDTAAVGGSSDANSAAFRNNGPDRYTTFSFDNAHGEFRKGLNTLEVVVEHAYGTPVALSVGVHHNIHSNPLTSARATAPDGSTYENITGCGDFNIYTPGSPLPAGYQDLNDIFPHIVLDENGRVTLPCVPTVTSSGLFVPEVLSVSYSYYGQPICAVIVDCNQAGAGTISATVTNVNRGQSYPLVAQELCSNAGVFFGCVDSAYGPRMSPSQVGNNGVAVTGEFSDTIRVQYVDTTNGLVSNAYNVYLVCGQTSSFNFSLVSGLLLRDALENNIDKLLNLRDKIVDVQGLLFNNTENIPCDEIAQSTDLSQTALDFFNFLDCLGNRELSEDAFLYSLESRNASAILTNTGLCGYQ